MSFISCIKAIGLFLKRAKNLLYYKAVGSDIPAVPAKQEKDEDVSYSVLESIDESPVAPKQGKIIPWLSRNKSNLLNNSVFTIRGRIEPVRKVASAPVITPKLARRRPALCSNG